MCFAAMLSGCTNPRHSRDTIYSCREFTVYTDSVVQGDYVAKAVSPTQIVTNYRSPLVSGVSPAVAFRFSINSRDNELMPGQNHYALIGNPADSAKVYLFGDNTSESTPYESTDTLPENTPWTLRVDMRPMLRAFDMQGYYTTPTGDIIFMANMTENLKTAVTVFLNLRLHLISTKPHLPTLRDGQLIQYRNHILLMPPIRNSWMPYIIWALIT